MTILHNHIISVQHVAIVNFRFSAVYLMFMIHWSRFHDCIHNVHVVTLVMIWLVYYPTRLLATAMDKEICTTNHSCYPRYAAPMTFLHGRKQSQFTTIFTKYCERNGVCIEWCVYYVTTTKQTNLYVVPGQSTVCWSTKCISNAWPLDSELWKSKWLQQFLIQNKINIMSIIRNSGIIFIFKPFYSVLLLYSIPSVAFQNHLKSVVIQNMSEIAHTVQQ